MAIYTTVNQQIINLGRELGGGGEGTVYEVTGHPELVAKVYKVDKRTPERESKLKAMVANPPQDDTRKLSPPHISIAWPTDLLYEQSRFVGYLMPRISESADIYAVYNPQLRAKEYPGFNWKYLHRTARNLATALNALHARGYVMGDVNLKNVLVTQEALVTLVDTDSFQVRDATGYVHRCPVGMPEYTPPELQGMEFNSLDRAPYHDCFGLAVLIFQLLMEGQHPFDAALQDVTLSVGKVNLYCIRQGIFPYYKAHKGFKVPPNAPDFKMLHSKLQNLFVRCFDEGYKNPSARPAALEWIEALKEAENALVECEQNPSHWYSNHLKECPWCKRGEVPQPPLQERLPIQPVQPLEPIVTGAVQVVTTTQSSFIFPNGQQANDPQELVRLIDANWDASRECLYRGLFEKWLAGIGQSKLAIFAQDAVRDYPNDQSAGLEKFAQRLATELGMALATPQIEVSTTTLKFGRVEQNRNKSLQLQIKNGAGRGYISGEVKCPFSTWLYVNPIRFAIPPTRGAFASINVTIDGTELPAGPNQATLVLEPLPGLGINPVQISVTCRASFPYIKWLMEVCAWGSLFGIASLIFLTIAINNIVISSVVLAILTFGTPLFLLSKLGRRH